MLVNCTVNGDGRYGLHFTPPTSEITESPAPVAAVSSYSAMVNVSQLASPPSSYCRLDALLAISNWKRLTVISLSGVILLYYKTSDTSQMQNRSFCLSVFLAK